MTLDPQPFLALMARFASAGILIQTLEVLWNSPELRDDRLFGWQAQRRPGGGWRRWPGLLHSYPGCQWLLGLRALVATLGLVVPYGGLAAAAVFAALVLLQLYYNRRFTMLAGNCETMFLVTVFAALAGTIPGGARWLAGAALVFVALQLAIAYAVAGWSKLRAPAWRSGGRLLQVVRDSSYRLPGPGRWLEARPRVTQAAARSVIVLECLLPCAILLPTPVCAVLLAAGLGFHTVIAITMGLHGFWWSFAAAYPSLWFTHELLSRS